MFRKAYRRQHPFYAIINVYKLNLSIILKEK